ncbi:MAG: thioredoxin domain-containing protein [Candidatus Thiodiazotropha sp. (ex Dulcina madagascariensis)]|nr:thioredoxin domain-containing protein [Candidatus Thiodiazotropha sp. (ex Dulcina madagascariensis)]
MAHRLAAGLILGLLTGQAASADAVTDHYQLTRPMQIQQKLNAAYLAKGVGYRPRTEHFKKDGAPRYINRLILEDSPYLLQHAHNPVDWHPWSEEAFERAKRENKPVFLSIGYSTCHWCHVMERESFEDPAIAALLNEHFVAIKVDRESHPDVDQVYMTAVMLLSGHGGWPMSSFLTPQGKPFFGGTYYPPAQFTSLLQQVQQLWRERRKDVEAQAERVAAAVAQSNDLDGRAKALDQAVIGKALAAMHSAFDELQGGFGQAPKFPREPWLYLLLDQAERHRDEQALQMLEVTLEQMARGGIYDQVGGGFHRYATDYEWLVPHFEKMLYNQAHLSRVYLGAWRLTGRERYRRVVTQTLDYVLREMTAPAGGFYSATDADSEGEEGLYFTWTPQDIDSALSQQDAELAKSLYGVLPGGNFEGRNILHLEQGLEAYAAERKLGLDALRRRLDRINDTLLQVRNRRVPPLRDDKIVTAWNGMMITAFAQAADILDVPAYRQAAEKAAEFLWQHNRRGEGRLWRVHLDGRSSIAATQEDYAYLGEALLYLYDLTADAKWLQRAEELADALIERFLDEDNDGFFMSEAESGITAMGRPKDEGSDNATPSGSSVAIHLLQRLWQRSGNLAYRRLTDALIARFAPAIELNPNSYAYLLSAVADHHHGELGARAYAALGGIRIEGSMTQASPQSLLTVEIDIPEAWHINSNLPMGKDLIATQMSLAEQDAGWRMGPVTYPQGALQSLAFQQESLSVYSGKLRLQAFVTQTHKNPANSSTLAIEIRLQACNDQVCLPPESLTLRIGTSFNPQGAAKEP